MSKRNDGGSAFPISNGGGIGALTPGMSLRDYFAAQFMSAVALHIFDTVRDDGGSARKAGKMLAKVSYKMADDMLAERSKG